MTTILRGSFRRAPNLRMLSTFGTDRSYTAKHHGKSQLSRFTPWKTYVSPFVSIHPRRQYINTDTNSSGKRSNNVNAEELDTVPIVPINKKSLATKIKDELRHYWTGSKLLGAEIKISFRLLAKIMGGQKLLRRERRQLKRTMADLARLVPFFVILIIPFMELALPFIIKFFPGFLPSTFHTKDSKEIKKLNLQKTRLEAAKLLRATTMDDADRSRLKASSKTFSKFLTHLDTQAAFLSVGEMVEIAKLFPNPVTIQGLPRSQLINICRYLDIVSIGPDAFIRAFIQRRLNYIDADDHTIISESVSSYSDKELKQICSMRGMRVHSKSREQLLEQLNIWLHLSTNKKLPNALLILSNAAELVDCEETTQDPIEAKLKSIIRTIYSLPEGVLLEAKVAIKEAEGTATFEERLTLIQEQEEFIEKELSDEENKNKEKDITDNGEESKKEGHNIGSNSNINEKKDGVSNSQGYGSSENTREPTSLASETPNKGRSPLE